MDLEESCRNFDQTLRTQRELNHKGVTWQREVLLSDIEMCVHFIKLKVTSDLTKTRRASQIETVKLCCSGSLVQRNYLWNINLLVFSTFPSITLHWTFSLRAKLKDSAGKTPVCARESSRNSFHTLPPPTRNPLAQERRNKTHDGRIERETKDFRISFY